MLGSPLAAHLNSPLLKALRADAVVPDHEIRHARVLRHCRAIRRCRETRNVVSLLISEGVVLRGKHETRRQTHDVPLEWARVRLVEVVDVEDNGTILPCEKAEVRQMGITAQLHNEPGVGH